MSQILSTINNLEDLKKLNSNEMNSLAKELRNFVIENVSKTGGHLASNLGVVELTLALHRSFNSPKDKIIWDVGHQSYIHKIITGRKDKFKSLRQIDGLSGFPKRDESKHDAFETGHSSTSISAGIGMALARDVKKENSHVVSVIGDGAMTAGMAFEALNHAGDLGTNLIVILNDNEMSISKNVGGMSQYLDRIRTAPTYSRMKGDVESFLNRIPAIGNKVYKTAERAKDSVKYFLVPGIFFEELGFKYLGPVDGHNINELLSVLNRAKKVKGPVIVHTVTKKGKGYKPAEDNPGKYHSSSPFEIETGKPLKKSNKKKYSNVLGESVIKHAKKDEKVVAITAAMPAGTGLSKFKEEFPNRFFDVGIAEQHGVTLAAGMASQGIKPIYAVYSTFLQRGYDQVLHDVCIQNLPVTLAIDRAGLVGNDGETHHGVFDFSYLSHLPNMTIMAPKDGKELKKMIEFAIEYNGPVAVRYPRGYCYNYKEDNSKDIQLGKGEILKEGKDIAILAIGKMVEKGVNVYKSFKEKGQNITLVNARFVKPLDNELLDNLMKNHNTIVTLEDNSKLGGFGSMVNNYLINNNYDGRVLNIGLPDNFVEHGDVEELFKRCGMDEASIIKEIKKKINGSD
ncbi:MAG: 1-deoxy-D-xylulose-5-phosphate synthase [Firmicutes bacterium]|nr:1-deoxy-D-xylulose-5-phosphate synthase [Bacillota bacterium]